MGSRLELVEAADIRRLCPPRPDDSHKGSFGRLAVVAGSRGKAGAAILAARGALRAGAGLVTVFCPRSLEESIVAALPEAMTLGLPEENGAIAEEAARPAMSALRSFDAAVVGPGLSTAAGTVAFLRRLLAARLPMVCDADALNAFPGGSRVFASRILTPHPGEAGRLLGISTREVQADRLSAARALARASRAVVLLKGAASLVAAPGGGVVIGESNRHAADGDGRLRRRARRSDRGFRGGRDASLGRGARGRLAAWRGGGAAGPTPGRCGTARARARRRDPRGAPRARCSRTEAADLPWKRSPEARKRPRSWDAAFRRRCRLPTSCISRAIWGRGRPASPEGSPGGSASGRGRWPRRRSRSSTSTPTTPAPSSCVTWTSTGWRTRPGSSRCSPFRSRWPELP